MRPLILLLTACTAPPKGGQGTSTPADTALADDTGGATDTADSGEPTDTADSGEPTDTADSGEPPSAWLSEPWVASRTLPAERGMAWKIDEDFLLESLSVPTLLVDDAGEYRMFMSVMTETDYGKVGMLRSTDGVSWEGDPEIVLSVDQFEGGCGDAIADVAIVYLDQGFRMLIEGYGTGDDPTRVFCSAFSDDGDTWTPEGGQAYTGSEDDHASISVPEVMRVADDQWFLYYVGNLPSIGGPDSGDGIRLASSDDGHEFTPLVQSNMLASHDTDPWPMRLEDGRLRLYHTHPVVNGRLAASDSEDGLSFDESTYLDGLDNDEPDEDLWLDPAVAHLADDRLVIYFTRLLMSDGELQGTAIARAWSLD